MDIAAKYLLPRLAARRLAVRDEDSCGATSNSDSMLGLRVASIFIILVGSGFGALFPVLSRRSKWLHVPTSIFEFAKYFGSGVIIATAFIHLLDPALDALGSDCLPEGWSEYPYALSLAMLSIFSLFLVELIAFRWGSAKLAKLGMSHDAHGHGVGMHAAHGPEGEIIEAGGKAIDDNSDIEAGEPRMLNAVLEHTASQIIGVGILEFGCVLHSVLVGLTLAVDQEFKTLFVVLVFHQTFEGLGVGSRLAYMKLPPHYNYIPIAGAILYAITTPVGIAAGLGVRSTYNPNSATALITSGVMDSLSAGILIYTGLVELLAHEFLFNPEVKDMSNLKLAYSIGTMLLGCALMALLGKWA